MGFFGTRSTNTGSTNRERGAAKNRTQTVSKKAKAKVQTDRNNDSRDRLTNYKVGKVPAIVPGSTILNAGQKVRQKTFEINRDYYRDKVVGKSGYNDTFEDYSKYIKGRGEGKLDAMGRTIIKTGSGGENQNQGIELAKSASGTATTTGPGEIQKTATNTMTTKDAKKSSDAILVANKRKSRKSTIKTSATGLGDDNYTLAKKKLLG
tara:strand:- start:381 stop:1001 length:621 start_codon:yes stop_codon:yes gene_type:complete